MYLALDKYLIVQEYAHIHKRKVYVTQLMINYSTTLPLVLANLSGKKIN